MRPINMNLMDEPQGWRCLQEMAQQEKDPRVLASIIEKMNRLLDHHERIAAREPSRPALYGKMSVPSIKLEVHAWQLGDETGV